eukprot:TRINITY_DN30025_c0_g2_i1.p1 TRINITY_DN30025_c0_g2~~TRINITY_DN30025_c0_g2_i1.p1  ORF type:complete len:474 (+),score=102.74 TRINITY_DN30025_c0_g2_i1:102-1523(+)
MADPLARRSLLKLVQAGTAVKVKFVQPNPKQEGSRAHARYAAYSSAKTVKQALALGAAAGDISFDARMGHLIVTSRLLETPLKKQRSAKGSGKKKRASKKEALPRGISKRADSCYDVLAMFHHFAIVASAGSLSQAKLHLRKLEEVKSKVQEHLRRAVVETGTAGREVFVAGVKSAVKEVLGSLPRSAPAWKYYTEIKQPAAKAKRASMNTSLEAALNAWNRLAYKEGVKDVYALASVEERRRFAQSYAESALQSLPEGRWPTDTTALACLRLWGFAANDRSNVLPDRWKTVPSDTLGLVTDRKTHKPILSSSSVGHESVIELLSRWARGKQSPQHRKLPLPFTSMTLNGTFASRLHRDRFNAGPSLIASCGDHSGGDLIYYPGDSGRGDVEMARELQSVQLGVKSRAAVIDGRCAHEVTAVEGERFSVVLFTSSKYRGMGAIGKRKLAAAGIEWPTDASLGALRKRVARLPS